MTTDQTDERPELAALLAPYQQQHVLRFWDEISATQQAALAAQVRSIDFDQLVELTSANTNATHWDELAEKAELPPAIGRDAFRTGSEYEQAQMAGEQALRNGEVAVILTAGGQGSRLGFEHPKGMYPIGPLSNRTLYQIILEHALSRSRQFGAPIPMYVMTSPPTHEESQSFLQEAHYFGYDSADIRLFCQGVMPAVDDQGKLILADKHTIFVSPDGHGGTLAALDTTGCLQDMQQRGIKYLFYGQIDNPLIQVCDPTLLGYHIIRQSEMTSQVVRKIDPLQKVGNVVSVDGQVQIIEYSDLSERFARQTNSDGSLKLWAGSIAVHVFDMAFLLAANQDAQSLSFHRAHKKVPYVDEHGNTVEPEAPNATKFEKFIFDLLPLAKNAIVCEVDPADGFCAVKNAPPAASETPAHVKAAISNLHKRWLLAAGVSVGEDVVVEINPLFAVDAAELAKKTVALDPVDKDTYFV